MPYEVMKNLISSEGLFDNRFIKIFINEFGIYPIGSYVELSTHKIAKVIAINANTPVRPIVYVIFDLNRNMLETAGAIDLVKQNDVYIIKPVTEQEVLRWMKV